MFLKQILISWVLVVTKVLNGEILCNSAHHFFESCLDNDSSNSTKAFLRQSKIPINKEEIQDYCNIFQRGIKCFQDYADKCINDAANRRLLEGEIMPAKNFYEMLCKDPIFVKDYLSHTHYCFQFIKKDWEKCTNLFHEVLNKEFIKLERERKSNINTQYMHFCCARYSYAKCVGSSAQAKCKPDSAKFTKALVELLSNERQFKNCARIEKPLCTSVSSQTKFLFPYFYFMQSLMFFASILNALIINV